MNLIIMLNALTKLTDKLQGWVTKGIKLVPNLIVAILILVIFFAIGRLVRKMVSRSLQKMTDNKAITGLLVKVAGLVTITIGIFFALWAIELSGVVTSLLAGAGVLGLAAGFALQDQAADFFAGILLSIRHPFAIGDIIESNGYYGNVHDINLRATVIKTTQGNLIHLPNSEVIGNAFTNYTWSGERRIDLTCGCSQAEDLEKVQQITKEALATVDEVKKDKPVQVFFTDFGGSDMEFVVRFWIDFDQGDLARHVARSNVVIAMRKYYDNNDIATPFPIRTIDFAMKGGEKLDDMLVSSDQRINASAE